MTERKLKSWTDRDAWERGLAQTLATIASSTSAQVVFLGDTPDPPQDIPRCISENPGQAVEACSFDFDSALSAADVEIAREQGWLVIETTPWICRDGRCPAVDDDLIVFRDASHISERQAQSLEALLERALNPILDVAVR